VAALIEVLDVERAEPLHPRLRGAYIDVPKTGSRFERHGLEVIGWVLGRERPAVAVEFVHEGCVVRRAPVHVERPDLAKTFKNVPWAGLGGFAALLPMLPVRKKHEIELRVVLHDQSRASLATLRIRPADTAAGEGATDSPSGAELVSVVIPCYNQAHFLTEAIESVIAQTHPSIEIVVVDDGSMDNASVIARSFPGVRCVRQRNQGLAAARNAGLRCTTGPYVVFLDADDRLLPAALEIGLAFLRDRDDYAFVSGSHRIVGVDGFVLWTAERRTIRSGHFEELLRRNYIATPGAVIYRRAVLEALGGFDTSLPVCEDYDLNLRITRDHPVYSHAEVVLSYRRHAANMSGKAAIMFETAMRVLASQKPFSRSRPALEQAYEDGRAFHRAYYGELLVGELGQQLRAGRWRSAIHGVAVLARRHPTGLVDLARRLGRSRRFPAVTPKGA
jgi:hypothetical protein